MPTGSCKRYTFTPFIGTTDVSCNHTAPQHDIIGNARKWYDIKPNHSVPVFHRLREKKINTRSIFFKEELPEVYDKDGNLALYRKTNTDFALNYDDFTSSNLFNIGSYYRGLPHFYRLMIRIVVYIMIIVFVWKIIIRPIIGPRGVLIHTDSLRDDVFHESLIKAFFNAINSLKVSNAKRVEFKVENSNIPNIYAATALNR